MPHNIFGELTIRMFDVINRSIEKNEKSIDMGNVLKRLTLDALTLAGFGKLRGWIIIYPRNYVTRLHIYRI